MYGACALLHVPAALPLALVAAVMDVLPVLGVIATKMGDRETLCWNAEAAVLLEDSRRPESLDAA